MALCHFLPSKPFIRSKASFPKQSKEGMIHFSVLESVSLISFMQCTLCACTSWTWIWYVWAYEASGTTDGVLEPHLAFADTCHHVWPSWDALMQQLNIPTPRRLPRVPAAPAIPCCMLSCHLQEARIPLWFLKKHMYSSGRATLCLCVCFLKKKIFDEFWSYTNIF